MSKFGTSAPSASRHHADWLSLVEYSGLFVSLPVMLRVFPQGLEPRDPAQAKALRAAFEEWQDNPTAPGKQLAWVLHVLTAMLGYPSNQITEGQTLPAGLEASMPEMGETLRPDFALIGPTGSDAAGQAQLLIASYPAEQKLDRPTISKHWKATPATRMMELLHCANVPLGLVTNGEQWMLVYAPRGEITGYASWYGALWLDEPITLRAFHSLLGVRRFFGVAADSTLLALLKESASDQQEVTDQLGYQVREAVEVLVQSFDAIDKESNRSLLKGVSPTTQYEAALTIMMRLVFLFSAEERGLLHLGKPLYDNNYAVSTLQEQLQEVADHYGEEVLERRTDAWARLLASFRAVHGGIKHQDLLMQAYGGSLFDPDRYPFLEGRAADSGWRSTPAEPLAVNNRVVLHLLNSLQRLRIKVGAGGTAETRRISFRALGVEQIGHVYEGLLDHAGVRATETVLGIKGTRKKEPEISLSTLEALLAQGEDKLFEYLKEPTGRTSVSPIKREFAAGSLLDDHKLLVACGHDEALLARLRPFAGLIREDSFERPMVVLDGSVYVTAGTTRRSTGTHYTPPSLTEPIVQHTLEPLVYEGPAEGWPREQWKLKSPKAILDLKVCDMAMGSGAFLVQACRYLAERLTEAWENEEKQHPGQVLITPDGKFSEGAPGERLVPADANERIAIARRVVADRCLYGVDINPMAVEMAKLSLWLITVDANRPFTFLDHAFKCGDSLLGITSLEQLENFSLRPGGGKQQAFGTLNLWRHIDEAKKKREALEEMPSDTPEQIALKAALYAAAEDSVAKLNSVADVLVAVELSALNGRAYDTEREASSERAMAHWVAGPTQLRDYALLRLGGRRPLHWALAFPEIMARNGFAAFVLNPPYLGGRNITSSPQLGKTYNDSICAIYQSPGTSADLCSYFLSRAWQLMQAKGEFGCVVVETIASGPTGENGLCKITHEEGAIRRASTNVAWPGEPQRRVVLLQITKQSCKWAELNGKRVSSIAPNLTENTGIGMHMFRLRKNENRAFQGITVFGDAFIVSSDDYRQLCAVDEKSIDILTPYLTGGELNGLPLPRSSSFVIDFRERSELDASRYVACFDRLEKSVKDMRQSVTSRKDVNEKWWRLQRVAPELEEAAARYRRILCRTRYSAIHGFCFVEKIGLLSDGVLAFAFEDMGSFAVLQSDIHLVWSEQHGSPRGGGLRYRIKSCFDTFPFPETVVSLDLVGTIYYEHRAKFMLQEDFGLTQTYNRFHSADDTSTGIADLRRLHIEMDQAVASAYGWQDLDLCHGFHETKQGIRYTISEAARREVLDRLLALNHQRHAEEEAELAAQSVSASAKRGRKKTVSILTPGLFD